MVLKTAVFFSIHDIPQAVWDKIAATHSITFSYRFWSMLEAAALPNFSYQYVVMYDAGDVPVAAAAFYVVATDIAIFAPLWLRAMLSAIRRIWPNFLILRMLECGTPVTLTSPPFIAQPGISPDTVLSTLHHVMMEKAKKEGQLLLVMRDFEENALHMRPSCKKLGYHWVKSLPNTYFSVKWKRFEDYLASMKSYYRCKVVKHRKRALSQHYRHEVVDDFAAQAETLCKQWMVVHEQADEFQREVLTTEFYRHFSSELGDNSKVIYFYQNDILVGHALLLKDGDLLRWLYFGRTHATNDSLYLYVGQSIIDTAIKLGVSKVEMGLTTYPIKQDMGASIAPIFIAVRACPSWMNPFVGLVYPLLNHIPVLPPKDVFKQ